MPNNKRITQGEAGADRIDRTPAAPTAQLRKATGRSPGLRAPRLIQTQPPTPPSRISDTVAKTRFDSFTVAGAASALPAL